MLYVPLPLGYDMIDRDCCDARGVVCFIFFGFLHSFASDRDDGNDSSFLLFRPSACLEETERNVSSEVEEIGPFQNERNQFPYRSEKKVPGICACFSFSFYANHIATVSLRVIPLISCESFQRTFLSCFVGSPRLPP